LELCQKKKVAGVNFQRPFVNIVVAHTGQSSQLFTVTIGRNALFLATVARSGLSMQDEYTGVIVLSIVISTHLWLWQQREA